MYLECVQFPVVLNQQTIYQPHQPIAEKYLNKKHWLCFKVHGKLYCSWYILALLPQWPVSLSVCVLLC